MLRVNLLKLITLVLASGCMVLFCRNPLGLDGRKPLPQVHDLPERAKPEGLIDQLIDSYNERNIDLFKDLFPKDRSFRFFVAPSNQQDYKVLYPQLYETRDTLLQFLEESESYYYWTQEVEEEKHENLFKYAESIKFDIEPGLQNKRLFAANGDSLAELLVTGGKLLIGQSQGFDTTIIWEVPIDKQVFLALKDTVENLWVLKKWYDFSSGGN